jgi:Uma2 family endonuclease
MANGTTSAAAVGAHMPASLTLDDIAAMAVADEYGHRYEMSPEGVLSVMPPAAVEHAILASRLLVWFVTHGWRPDQVLQNCGLRIPTSDGTGGRVPDLTVWDQAPKTGEIWATVERLQVAIEIVSKGSEAMDHVTKRAEYAAAGIARYWLVDRDNANTVIRFGLAGHDYVEAGRQPLAWLLSTDPRDHL